ncbi:hypothetical protein BJX99DRAFT_64662 [Aspergillus californicus]
MAPRPELYPLQTPDHIKFPSELQEDLRGPSNPEPTTRTDGKGPSVPPPLAYTEFLKALSPTFGSPYELTTADYPGWGSNRQLPSPLSLPSTASFPGHGVPSRSQTQSASHLSIPAPHSARETNQYRRIRMSPSYLCSPRAIESPRSAHAVRSPYPPIERRARYIDSPIERRTRYIDSPAGTTRSITIQHIVTHTVTLKRVPSLNPPPKGKRRKTSQAPK